VPVGFSPAAWPNCGIKLTGTSLLTGTEDTERVKAAREKAVVVILIVLEDDKNVKEDQGKLRKEMVYTASVL
jgi:hypothetical protein